MIDRDLKKTKKKKKVMFREGAGVERVECRSSARSLGVKFSVQPR